jgi:hypothetical protein
MVLFTNMSVVDGSSEEEMNLQKLFLPQLQINQPFSNIRPPAHIKFRQYAAPERL